MNDKLPDFSKKFYSSTTEYGFPSPEKQQRAVKEEKQNTPSNIAFSSGEDFSKSIKNSRRTTEQESIKSVHSLQKDRESITLMYENANPGSIKKKPIIVYVTDCSGRATEDYSSKTYRKNSSTSTDTSCSYDPTEIKYHSMDHYNFPFVCEYCSKGFQYNLKYNIHVRSHTGAKPFKCDFCDKRFSSLQNLTDHTNVHTGGGPFRCQKCNKSFNRPYSLAQHVRTHTGEKPYSCPICGKDFSQKGSLRRHGKTHKGMINY